MATRRIKYLTPQYYDDRSYIGGGERLPLNWARGVVEASRGAYAVEIISFSAQPSCEVLYPGVTLRVLKATRRPSNPLDVVSWELPAAIADADLVHIHQAFTRCGEMGLLVAKQQCKPVCVTDHGGSTSTLGMQLGSMDLADRVIPVSNFGASLVRTKTSIQVIKGGVDGSFFTRPDHSPPRDRVLFVGRLLPHKGVDRLIEALPLELPLTVSGCPYHPEYDRHLKERAKGKQVEFTYVPQEDGGDEVIRQLYRQAWVNVLPSVYRDCFGQSYTAPELMGLTLLEAMACGTPAICSRVGGMPEFIRHGETGFVFDELGELTHYLRLLAENPALVQHMGHQARLAVEQEYDLKAVGAKLVAVYEELISQTQEVAA